MKEGSLVQRVKDFNKEDMNYFFLMGITRIPTKEDIYEVALLRKPIYTDTRFRMCIVLVEFPEYEAKKIDMDADAFVEVLPPAPNLMKELEPEELLLPI